MSQTYNSSIINCTYFWVSTFLYRNKITHKYSHHTLRVHYLKLFCSNAFKNKRRTSQLMVTFYWFSWSTHTWNPQPSMKDGKLISHKHLASTWSSSFILNASLSATWSFFILCFTIAASQVGCVRWNTVGLLTFNIICTRVKFECWLVHIAYSTDAAHDHHHQQVYQGKKDTQHVKNTIHKLFIIYYIIIIYH